MFHLSQIEIRQNDDDNCDDDFTVVNANDPSSRMAEAGGSKQDLVSHREYQSSLGESAETLPKINNLS